MNETTDTASAGKETMGFQTEVRQLLDLVIHSLYSNKDIFLRELISNASDAADKLGFEALQDEGLYEGDGELRIQLDTDKDNRTLTISDNGIGMSRDEVMENLGTIAKSGTRQFFEALTGDQAKDSQLIGQFGVGFYSSFIVADKVSVVTRRAGCDHNEGVRWESTGEGEYTIESVSKATRGTDVILHLREDLDDLLDDWRLRNIIHKYSEHISLPIMMLKQPVPGTDEEEDKKEQPQEPEYEMVNKGMALWTRSKSDISDEEYNEFYKHVSHDFEEPLARTHNQVEGKLEYTSLLYIPSRAPFDLWDRNLKHGVKLYVQRVFIMDDADQLMPSYLRFVKGIIDTNDLPLNISREILQQNKQIDAMRSGSVKKILGLLEGMARNETEKYATFWKEFGRVLKEGIVDDYSNRERVAGLLRFASTANDDDEQEVSLDAYIERMQEGQDKIYYITAESFAAAKNSPHLEIFTDKGIEVLLLTDPVDEWVVQNLESFKEKSLQSVTRGELDLAGMDSEESEDKADASEEHEDLIKRLGEALADRVTSVSASKRLTSSPACLVASENDMGANMERLLKAAGQNINKSKPNLEINLQHPLLKKMDSETDEQRFTDWASILHDQAVLSEGGKLEDPAAFVKKLNNMFMEL